MKILDKGHVGSIFYRGFVFLGVVLFLSITAFGTPVKIYIDIDGTGPADLVISSGIDWDFVLNPLNLGDKQTWYGDNGTAGWSLAGGASVGYVSITVTTADPLNPNPEIELGFAVQAGSSDTTFSIYSDALSLGGGLANAQAYAYADMRIITSSGKSINGGYDTEAYRALYNGSTEFTQSQLLNTPINSPSSLSDSSGWQAIPGVVSDMRPEWAFTVSAGAPVSATSRYEMTGDAVPEPASVLLLGLGCLGLLKRRKR